MKLPFLPILLLAVAGSSAPLLRAAEPAKPAASAELPPPPVWGGPREYEVDELTPIVNRALLRGDRDFARGEKIFSDIGCKMCHLFGGGAGGIGPDITGVGGRFGAREILEAILEPSKVISDLYGMKEFSLKGGKSDRGKFIEETEEETSIVRAYSIDPNTLTAYWGNDVVKIKNSDIVDVQESETSNMIPGLINTLKEDEVADLIGFLISGGDPSNRMFAKFKKPETPAAAPASGSAPASGAAATNAPAAGSTNAPASANPATK